MFQCGQIFHPLQIKSLGFVTKCAAKKCTVGPLCTFFYTPTNRKDCWQKEMPAELHAHMQHKNLISFWANFSRSCGGRHPNSTSCISLPGTEVRCIDWKNSGCTRKQCCVLMSCTRQTICEQTLLLSSSNISGNRMVVRKVSMHLQQVLHQNSCS